MIISDYLRVVIIDKIKVNSMFPHDDEGIAIPQLVKVTTYT